MGVQMSTSDDVVEAIGPPSVDRSQVDPQASESLRVLASGAAVTDGLAGTSAKVTAAGLTTIGVALPEFLSATFLGHIPDDFLLQQEQCCARLMAGQWPFISACN
jgi:hypothetical protein